MKPDSTTIEKLLKDFNNCGIHYMANIHLLSVFPVRFVQSILSFKHCELKGENT